LFFVILINIIIKFALEDTQEKRQKKYKKELIHIIDTNQDGVLSSLTNLTNEELFETPNHYSKVLIPKKTGGQRTLHIPNPELKEVQNGLKAFIESTFQYRVHFTCHSYRKNKGIISNAYPHLGNEVLIKLDIKDYFKNITKSHIKDALYLGNKSYFTHPYYKEFCQYIPEKLALAKDYLDFPENEDALMRLLHTDNGLPQGAPTSPVISNLVLSKFDHEIFMVVKSMDGKYSRYSDDLTISFKTDESDKIKRVIKFTESKLAEYGFQLNKKKGKIHVLRKHQAQRICGITINSGKPTISRQHRRLIRAAKHNLKQGKEIQFSDNQLIGHDAFIQMVMGKNL
jgi:RNA-directed DNA polymerase